MNVRKIRIGDIWDGDIIAVSASERLDNDFESKKWSDHFALRRRYFCVVNAKNNFIAAKDSRGRAGMFEYGEIEAAYRKEN